MAERTGERQRTRHARWNFWPLLVMLVPTTLIWVGVYALVVWPHFDLGPAWLHLSQLGEPGYRAWARLNSDTLLFALGPLFGFLLVWWLIWALVLPVRRYEFTVVRGLHYLGDTRRARRRARQISDHTPQAIALHDALRVDLRERGMMLVGAKGSGKTQLVTRLLHTLIAQPPAAQRERRLIVYDDPGEQTRTWPTDDFILIAPWHLDGWWWDLNEDITNISEARQFATLFIPESTKTSNPMWVNGARQVLAGLMHYLSLRGELSFPRLLRVFTNATDAELRAMLAEGNPEALRTLGQLEALGPDPGEAQRVHYAETQTSLLIFCPRPLQAALLQEFPAARYRDNLQGWLLRHTPDHRKRLETWVAEVNALRDEIDDTEGGNFNRTGQSFIANVSAYFSTVTDLAFAWSGAQPDARRFSLKRFLSDAWDGPEALILQGSEMHKELMRALNGALIGMAIRRQLGPYFPEVVDRDHPYHCYYFMDELDALGQIPEIIDLQSRGRKKGLIFIPGIQDINQVKKTYGNELAQTWASQMGVHYIGAIGIGDTANWVSDKLIGKQEIQYFTSQNSVSGSGMSSSVSTQFVTQPVVTPSELGSELGVHRDRDGQAQSVRAMVFLRGTTEVLRLDWPIVRYPSLRPAVIPNPRMEKSDFQKLFIAER